MNLQLEQKKNMKSRGPLINHSFRQIGMMHPDQFSFCSSCDIKGSTAEELSMELAQSAVSLKAAESRNSPTSDFSVLNSPVHYTLHISGMCCSSEIPSVRAILKKNHATNIRFNVVNRTVYFETSSAVSKIMACLQKAGFPASNVADSTSDSGVTTSTVRLDCISQDELDKMSIDGVHSMKLEDVIIRVVHDSRIPIAEISQQLSDQAVVVDSGETANATINSIPPNVILSGVFWGISLFGDLLQIRLLQVFGLLAVCCGLPPIVIKAYKTVRRQHFDANCMMVIAALGSVLLGEFQEAASVAFLFSISEFLEQRASLRARKALQRILSIQPNHAIKISSVNNEPQTVSIQDIQVNDILQVRVGDKIAADGVVVEGRTSLDCSSLTGESVPVTVEKDSTVQAGSINTGEHVLYVKVLSKACDSTVSRLVKLVENAQTHRSKTEKLVDRFAQAYTPIVVVVAFFLATVSWIFGMSMGMYWTRNALILIVIACPCALTISTPVTYAAGLAACAQHGVICKTPEKLELLGSVDTVVLDKTGTLTQGKFRVTELFCLENRSETLELLGIMEAPSSHPLSAALVSYVQKEGIHLKKMVTDHENLPGEGVTGIVRGRRVYVGNRKLFERLGMYEKLDVATKQQTESWYGTIGYVGIENSGIVGCYCLADVVRPEAKEAIACLQSDGITVFMLTGDSDSAAMAVAKELCLPRSAIRSQMLPEDKLHFVGSLKTPDTSILKKSSKVLFCGDGVNDVPVLAAAADVGVSMGEGAAVALEMSDVTLMDNNIAKLVYVTRMGKRVLSTVKENIFLSLFCKLLVVGLTFAGYMTLFYAIASDVGVMLLVTLNGMKLLPKEPSPGSKLCLRFRYDLLPTFEQNRSNMSEVSTELV